MSMERVLKAVMILGLSEADAQVYVFLAMNGPNEAKEIIKKINVRKEQLYRSLKILKNKDVVRASIDYPAVFSAIPFEEILDLLAEIKKEQAQALWNVRKELLKSWREMAKETSEKS